MRKIKDRITLGLIGGIIGNIAKEFTSQLLIRRLGFGNVSGKQKAAGIFLPKYKVKINSPKTQIVGRITDNIVAGMMGVIGVYILSFTGKDNYKVKALGLSHFLWTTMYGVFSRMGASSMHPMNENNSLNGLINHSVFGLVAAEAIVRLGDPNLFKPKLKSLGEPKPEE